jgi:ribosomal protein S18 acetylase RimI-like enzyme
MCFDIQFLPPEKWRGYELFFNYTTSYYFDVRINEMADKFGVIFEKKPFENTIEKRFTDKLYQPFWDNAEAYGVFDNEKLIACIEIWHEKWSNRLRVTKLCVDMLYRRHGIGKALMELVKKKAKEIECRAIILETQSCNENAISFYMAQGFSFFGFDRSCYGNKDIENREVRLELGLYVD